MMTDTKNFTQKLDKSFLKSGLSKKQKMQFRVLNFLVSVVLISAFFLFSSISNAAECRQAFYTHTGESGGNGSTRPYVASYTDTGLSAIDCTFEVVLTADEYQTLAFYEEQFGGVQPITPEEIAISFSWGFGTYLTFWWLSWVIKTARMTIRRM